MVASWQHRSHLIRTAKSMEIYAMAMEAMMRMLVNMVVMVIVVAFYTKYCNGQLTDT